MEKEFVPYELAVKLKTLGFDEPCFVYYKRSNENKPAYPNHGVIQNSVCGNGITAPTFSQAFRWFREEHDLDNAVLKDRYVIETQEDLPVWYYGFNTYEEAELACLTKLIDLKSE
jgi:hypothetical protein